MYKSAWGEPKTRDLTHCLDSGAVREPLSLTGSGCSTEDTDGNVAQSWAPVSKARAVGGAGASVPRQGSGRGRLRHTPARCSKGLNPIASPAAAQAPSVQRPPKSGDTLGLGS